MSETTNILINVLIIMVIPFLFLVIVWASKLLLEDFGFDINSFIARFKRNR